MSVSNLEITFNQIVEVNERLFKLNILELSELRNHLSKRYKQLMETVIGEAPKPLNPKGQEYKKVLLSTLDKHNYNAPFLKYYIKKIDNIKLHKHIEKFDATIFLDPPSQKFFNYVFEHWLSKETTLNHLHFVFRKLWINNPDVTYIRPDNYIVTSSFRLFAENWNKKYLQLCSSKKIQINRFNLRTFDEIGLPVCAALDKKINAIELEYTKAIKNTHKLP